TTGAVLLVEPSRTQANIIRSFLVQLGTANPLVVPSGQMALEAINQARPEVVLCAMHLADMTGVELVRQVRANPPLADVGFVLITSEADTGSATTVQTENPPILLTKPFDLERLSQALRQAGAARA